MGVTGGGRGEGKEALGEGGARTRQRPASSREVDKAAAAFDVSGELILNRYKMAEGDEVSPRQQPRPGLRRRRRTSDSSTGANHVSSTTFLGKGRRDGGRRARVGRGRGPLGLAGSGHGRRGRPPGLARLSTRRRVGLPGLAPAAPRALAARVLKGRPAGRSSAAVGCTGGARVCSGSGPLPVRRVAASCVRPDLRGRP